MLAKTETDWNPDDDILQSLHKDALRIADGTWDSYHQRQEQRDQLFNAAVSAIVQMGNCSYQQHLNQTQAEAIEAFLAFDGSDRELLCDEIWNEAKDKVDRCWRDGTHDALEELRTKELYGKKYGKGLSI